MPSRLIFLPVEPYQSRYTQYTSVADGVYETCFREAGIKFHSIRPDNLLRHISQGQVLDVSSRTQWAFGQISTLVEMIVNKMLDPKEDVIYLEDFFTPGFEMIPYAQSSVFGSNPMEHIKVYSFCHAQSFDPYDFTHTWQWWLRPLEKMWFEYQTKVFCAAREMIPLISAAGISLTKFNQYCVVPIGHAFHKEAMLRLSKVSWYTPNRQKTVIYSSRWDIEKNPKFFMELMKLVLEERKDITFKICTGRPGLTSNYPDLLNSLGALMEQYTPNIIVLKNLSLSEYYSYLRQAKVLFNCAFQDWISYVLLDATINGCEPLFPEYLSFPDALNHDPRFLYKNMDLKDAKEKLYALIDTEEVLDLAPIYEKYEGTVQRILLHMGFKV